MYILYNIDKFNTLTIDKETDPKLWAFVEETKTKGPKFSNYTVETLEKFVDRIYELRKNNSNNTAG